MIITAAIIFRLPGYTRPLWNDEIYSMFTLKVNIFKNPFYWNVDIHQPLYFYYLKMIVLIRKLFAPNSIYILRFLSSLLSIFLILFILKYYKNLKNRIFTYVLSILIAITPIQIYYSQELRPYYLTLLFLGLQFYFYGMLFRNNNSKPKYLYLYFITGLFSLLTHLTAIFAIPSYILVTIFFSRKSLVFRKFIITNILLFFIGIALILITRLNPAYSQAQEAFSYTNNLDHNSISIQYFITRIIRVKELLTMYFWYGINYDIVAIVIQQIFKKVLFVTIAIASIYPFAIKKEKQYFFDKAAIIILYFSIFQILVADSLGLFPFGGRYTMPFSFFLLFIISNLIYRIIKLKKGFIFGLIFVISLSLLFLFHESCNSKLESIKWYDDGNRSEAYNICIDKIY